MIYVGPTIWTETAKVLYVLWQKLSMQIKHKYEYEKGEGLNIWCRASFERVFVTI